MNDTPQEAGQAIRTRAGWDPFPRALVDCGIVGSLKLPELRTYLVILSRGNTHGYPISGAQFTRDTRLKRNRVFEAIQELERRGLVGVSRSKGKASEYRVLPVAIESEGPDPY